MTGVDRTDEFERLEPADLAERDSVGGQTERLLQQYGEVGAERGVEVDDVGGRQGRARACPQ
jgi:hypothetical protein